MSLFLVHGCLLSPKELKELNADNNFHSPAQTIKCMQMPSPQRPTPINKKGEARDSYDQSDCYDDLLTKDQRHLKLCLLYTSPSPRDATLSRMPSSA